MPQSGTSHATFTKTVSWIDPVITTSHLWDKAYLSTDDGLALASNEVDITINTHATFTLNITKEIPDVLQGDQVADFNFTVTKIGGGYSEIHPIHFAAGDTSLTIPVPGLEQGDYTVTEIPAPGFNPVPYEDGDNPSTKDVTLALPDCVTSVNFKNEVAGDPIVNVGKITRPVTIDGIRQDGGWDMTLLRRDLYGMGEYEVYSTLPDGTTPSDAVDPFPLKAGDVRFPEGEYKIEEAMKSGWKEDMREGQCEFTIDYPQIPPVSDYTCTFTNVKYAKILFNEFINSPNQDITQSNSYSLKYPLNSISVMYLYCNLRSISNLNLG